MNVQQIEYVIAVSNSKTFGEAASKCFVTQSTLSTMVARFEKEINVVIFDRSTKPVTLTYEGQKIIDQLKLISREISNLDEIVQLLKGEAENDFLQGKLRLGAIPTVAPYVLPQFLKSFLNDHPALQLEVSEITTQKIIDLLLSRDLDIGLVSIPLRHPDLIEIPLYTEPFLLYDRQSDDDTKVTTIEDLDLSRLWLLEEGHCLRNQVEKICNLNDRKLQVGNLVYKSGTIGTLLKLVNQNKGLTLLPHLGTLDLSADEKKYLHSFTDVIPVRRIGLVIHKHFVKKKVLKELQKDIQEKIKPLIGINAQTERVIDPLYD